MTDDTTTSPDALGDGRLFDVNEWAPATSLSLTDRFMVPPFTVLDTRQGYWQDRKREWQSLGIQSELGRGEKMTYHTDYMLEEGGRYDRKAQAQQDAARRLTYGEMEWDGYREKERQDAQDAKAKKGGLLGLGASETLGEKWHGKNSRKDADERSNVTGAPDLPEYADNGMSKMAPGTSIFDPMLTECMVRWHTPEDSPSHILDPFAGGSVRGIVSGILGRAYTGVELRGAQVEANRSQVEPVMGPFEGAVAPEWITGDSTEIDVLAGDRFYDMILSCPPYADLEVYSDDPADLSTMDYPDFIEAYRTIIARSVELLRPNRFAVWVVGEARDTSRQGSPSYGFIADTVKAFQDAGADLYNEAILVNVVGTLALRITRQFRAGRKMGRCHQHVLVFVKGDPMAAARWAEGDEDE